jgi:hypothetical protein
MSIPCWMYRLQMFFLVLLLASLFCWLFPWLCRSLFVWHNPICLLLLLLPVPMWSYLEKKKQNSLPTSMSWNITVPLMLCHTNFIDSSMQIQSIVPFWFVFQVDLVSFFFICIFNFTEKTIFFQYIFLVTGCMIGTNFWVL